MHRILLGDGQAGLRWLIGLSLRALRSQARSTPTLAALSAVARPLRRLADLHAQIPDAPAVKPAAPAIATASGLRGMRAPAARGPGLVTRAPQCNRQHA